MTEAAKASDLAVARREAARRLQQDLKLSLGQGQSLPDMLIIAPLAINLLGQIKLLAFSDKALCIDLEEPRSGFKYLQQKALSSAMIQIVDESADAFDSAEKNMRAIRMQTNVMFGKTGHVQTILMCLQDSRLAKRNLLSSMSRFQRDMETCAKRAQATEEKFDALVKCAGELSVAMAGGMATAGKEKVQIAQKKEIAKLTEEWQKSYLAILKAQVDDAQDEFTQARGEYQKAAAKGDSIKISDLAMAAAIGSGSSITGLINATINIFKETPKVAIETVKAASQWAPIRIYNTGPAAALTSTIARSAKENAVSSQQPAVASMTVRSVEENAVPSQQPEVTSTPTTVMPVEENAVPSQQPAVASAPMTMRLTEQNTVSGQQPEVASAPTVARPIELDAVSSQQLEVVSTPTTVRSVEESVVSIQESEVVSAPTTVKSIEENAVPRHQPEVVSAPTTVKSIEENAIPGQQPDSLGIDPALFAAEQIETQLFNLDRLLNEDLLGIVEDGGFEITACAQRLGDLKKGLGDFHSKHTLNARAILNEALDVTTAILAKGKMDKSKGDHDEWSKKINFWNNTMCPLFNRATKLRSFAASQPGQGFGGSMDSAALNVPPSHSSYSYILRQRYQRLLITRAAMNEARNNLDKMTQKQLEVQKQTIENARALKELESKETTMDDTKKILRKSIDIITAMQVQVRQLSGFFNALANIISIVCKGYAEQYLETIEAGITEQGDQFTLAYSEGQLQIIRESVIALRGHFSFVVHSVDMYREIATMHINPCIRLVANLRLSADFGERERAKRILEQETEKSSQAIQELAKKELETYHRDFEIRIQEIDEEIASIDLPDAVEDEENLKAIGDGVKEAGKKISEDLEEMGNLFEEGLDDL